MFCFIYMGIQGNGGRELEQSEGKTEQAVVLQILLWGRTSKAHQCTIYPLDTILKTCKTSQKPVQKVTDMGEVFLCPTWQGKKTGKTVHKRVT